MKGGNRTSDSKQSTVHAFGEYKTRSDVMGYADPDGYEEVEEFRCVEGCAVRLMDEQSGQRVSGWRDKDSQNAGMGYHGAKGNGGKHYSDKGGASRFFPRFGGSCGDTDMAGMDSGESHATDNPLDRLGGSEVARFHPETPFRYQSKASKKDRTANGTVENLHPTCKPTPLLRWLIRLVTPPGGVLLDCFAGSGSTGVAAILEGFNCILIEQDETYAETARARCEWAKEQMNIPDSPESPEPRPKPLDRLFDRLF